MSTVASATLQTPWDCKWSKFGRLRTARPDARVEGLWVCVYPDGVRRPVDPSTCEVCPHWEYEPPFGRMQGQPSARHSIEFEGVAASPHPNRAERRLELGTRIAALALAALLAGSGFVVLTRPLAVPLTISLWMGAAVAFISGVWGRFNRTRMPDESW